MTTSLVSDRDHFFGRRLKNFRLFLSSHKRPFKALFDLYVRCLHYSAKGMRCMFSDNIKLHMYGYLDIAFNEISLKT